MRQMLLVVSLLIVAALAVGCKSTYEKSSVAPKQSETAAAQLDKAKTETKEAAQAMQDYAYAQKAEFVAKMKRELAVIQEELDRLSAKVDSSSGAAKADAKAKLDVVREKWALAKTQLDRAESATESTWDDVQDGFKKAYSALKEAFESTRQWLSEKIKP